MDETAKPRNSLVAVIWAVFLVGIGLIVAAFYTDAFLDLAHHFSSCLYRFYLYGIMQVVTWVILGLFGGAYPLGLVYLTVSLAALWVVLYLLIISVSGCFHGGDLMLFQPLAVVSSVAATTGVLSFEYFLLNCDEKNTGGFRFKAYCK